MADASVLDELQLVERRRRLTFERTWVASLTGEPDPVADAFIEHAAGFARRHGIEWHSFHDVGVPDELLRRARINRPDPAVEVKMYERGASAREIADRLGLGETTVIGRLRRAGVTIRGHGGRHSQWTPDEQRQAVDRYLDGDRVREIADDLGANRRTIRAWVIRLAGAEHLRPRSTPLKLDDRRQAELLRLHDQGVPPRDVLARDYNIHLTTLNAYLARLDSPNTDSEVAR